MKAIRLTVWFDDGSVVSVMTDREAFEHVDDVIYVDDITTKVEHVFHIKHIIRSMIERDQEID
jgi:hypothetical protein